MVAQATFFPQRVIYIYAFFPLKMKYAALLLSAVELYFLVSSGRDGIGPSAHLFGAIGAWVYLQSARRWVWHGARIPSARNWKPHIFTRAAAQKGLLQVKQKRGSSVVVRRSPNIKTCTQCGAELPADSGPTCARCAAQQITQPHARPQQRGNAAPALEQPASLIILTGPLAGRRFTLSHEPFTMGRSSNNHVVIPDDKKVSRLHAEIVPDGHGRHTIVDKNSRNGVFINDKRTARYVLQPNDRIRIGATEMIFADHQEVR